MRIFFDVDDTIVACYDDHDLRPHVKEVFQRLTEDGHAVYLWSGMGLRWDVVRIHQLEQYVVDCFLKPTWDYAHLWRKLGVPFAPDFCVDNHAGVVEAFGGLVVPSYRPRLPDDEMLQVYQEIRRMTVGAHPGQ